jgi:hypothetical protein
MLYFAIEDKRLGFWHRLHIWAHLERQPDMTKDVSAATDSNRTLSIATLLEFSLAR